MLVVSLLPRVNANVGQRKWQTLDADDSCVVHAASSTFGQGDGEAGCHGRQSDTDGDSLFGGIGGGAEFLWVQCKT